MNKHKRLLSFVLALVMVVGMIPLTAIADDEPTAEICEVCSSTEHTTDGHVDTTSHIETCLEDCTGENCECACHQPAVVDDEPIVPESSEPASEPTVSESSEPAADPVEPAQVDEPTGPAVGDKIWIKHDSYVYKSQSAENGHKLLLNYEVEIVNIITDENGNAAWYEFAFTTTGIGEWLIREYKYVKVENTTVTNPDVTVPIEPEESKPVDENACNCGENAPENLADHADSCPRKQYVKSLFENKTAEEIYAQWETYDEATQTDLLNMLQKWDNAKYEELKKLTSADGFSATTSDGLMVSVSGYGLPDTVNLVINDIEDSEKAAVLDKISTVNSISVANVMFSRVLDLKLYNEGKEWQPEDGQSVTVSISGSENLISKFMMINHILDTESAVTRAINSGAAHVYTENGLSEIYPRETAAAKAVTGLTDTIYYTEIYNESGDIWYAEDESISFTLDSFSEIQIIGYTLNNKRDMPSFTAEGDSGEVILDKYIEYVEGDEYKLTLEAYSTGQKETKATDVVFIMDQSCSMYSPVEPNASLGGASVESNAMSVSTLKSMDMSKAENQKAALEGYYVAVYESNNTFYVIPVRYDNGNWQRINGTGSIANDKWVSQTIKEVWENKWTNLPTYTNGQSFTIYKSVYGAAYDAMEAFVDMIEGESGEGTPNCRAAIVGFSCPSSTYSKGPMNTGIYINGEQVFGLGFNDDQYANAFNDMSTSDGIEAFRNSLDAIRTSGQTTTTDAGFKLAGDLLNKASDTDTEKVVILFTDGKPENKISSNANDTYYTAAIAAANVVKKLANTTVYAYGINLGSATLDFLKALSSSYPNATSEKNLGNYVEPQCWGMAASHADIQQSFENIAQQIVSSSVAWDGTTKLRDIITDEFKLPEGASTDNIVVKTAAWTGSEFDVSVPATGLTVKISGGNTIDVSGFDYSTNYVTTGVKGGKKLIVEVPIFVDRTVCQGGNNLTTNTTDAGLWSGQNKIAAFPVPEVDVMTSISVHKKVVGKSYVDSFAFKGSYQKFEEYGVNKGLDLNAVTVETEISESIGNDGSFNISGIQVGSKLILKEENADLYEMTVVVKDGYGNAVTDGIIQDGKTITINSVVPGMQIEVTNTALLADLKIIKQGADDIDENQSFLFDVKDSDGKIVSRVSIVGNGYVIIKDLPVGTYTVTEDMNWSWRYDETTSDPDNGNVNLSATGENIITFTNKRTDPYWLSGDCYAENWWGNNGNVIRKDDEE